MKPFKRQDVVRINHPQTKNETGVINKIDTITGMVSVFRTKHGGFATWFDPIDLKRIGSTKRKSA